MRSISDIAPSKYRADIDGLRALAVASVIAFHAFPTVFPGGLIGVDVFFVISGFLITGIILDGLQKDAFSFAEFYRRRIRRIFPSLIVVLAASMIAGWFLLLPDEFTRLGKHVVASAAFIQNFILWGESGYFDKAAATKPLLHLWSLGVEEQFYIVWPLLLLAAGRLRLSKSWLVGSILAISFIVSLIYARQDSTLAFYSPVTRFWELMTGGMLAVVAGQNRYGKASSGARNLGGNIKSIVGLVAIALPICVLDDKSLFPGWWALLPTVGCYLVLSAGPEAWCNRIVLSWRPLVWLGLISYPLYLWHWPLLSFMTIAESRIPSVEARIGAVLISVALAWATYRFVESPIRFGARRAFKAYGACLAMALVAVLGLMVHQGFISHASRIEFIGSGNSPLERYVTRLANNPHYIEELDKQRDGVIRTPYCHMDFTSKSFAAYQRGFDQCLKVDKDKKNILILGDSHAADIYAALVTTYTEFNFLQATGAGCVPMVVLSTDIRCDQMFEYTLNYIRQNPVDAVIMEVLWLSDFKWINVTINNFKSLGARVILVGPPVTFTAEVPKIIERKPQNETLDDYLAKRQDESKRVLEHDMETFAQEKGVGFIPYTGTYCVDGKCPVLNQSGELLIFDESHLTVSGASYLGGRIKQEQLLEKLLGM